MGTERYAFLFKPGTYGTAAKPAAGQGRLLHRDRRPGRVPDRRHDQRQGRGLQPLPRRRRHQQLHRAQQLLADPVEPVAARQRRRPGRVPCLGRVLGRLPGRLHAPARHQRGQPVPDGLLHRRSAVRQRRLHRRLPAAVRHQRLAAAVADPEQRDRRVEQRGVERRLLGRRRRAIGGRLPRPRLHDAGPDSREPGEAVPLRGRPGPVCRAGARRAAQQPGRHLGRRPDRGAHDSR